MWLGLKSASQNRVFLENRPLTREFNKELPFEMMGEMCFAIDGAFSMILIQSKSYSSIEMINDRSCRSGYCEVY